MTETNPSVPDRHPEWKFGFNETISFTIATPSREALDSYADKEDISRNEAIRRAISQLTGVPDTGNRHRYATEQERHETRLARRAKRREARRGG